MYHVPEMTELEELECMYCEMYKDVYGVKARWYKAETVEQAREDLAKLQTQGEAVWAEEKKAQERSIAAFEELVSSAPDRESAIRWQHQAYDTRGDDEFLEYQLNLPYGYLKRK